MLGQRTRPLGDRGWLALLISLIVIQPIGMDMFLPSLPAISTDLGSDRATTQLTVTAFLIGIAAGQFIGGPTSDRTGRRWPLLAGLGIFAASMLIGAAAPSIGPLVACRAAAGLGAGVVVVATFAVVRDRNTGVAAARTFSQFQGVMALSGIFAPLVGALMVGIAGWRPMTATIGLVGAGALLSTYRNYPETLIRTPTEVGWIRRLSADAGALVRDRDFVGYALVIALANGAAIAGFVGSSFVLQRQFGLSVQMYGLVLAVCALGILATSQFSARRVRRYGARRLTIIGLISCSSGALLMFVGIFATPSLPFVLVGLFLLMATMGLVQPNVRALAAHHHSERAGSAYAILGVLQWVSGGLAIAVTGLLPLSPLGSMATVVAVLSVSGTCAVLITSPEAAAPSPRT